MGEVEWQSPASSHSPWQSLLKPSMIVARTFRRLWIILIVCSGCFTGQDIRISVLNGRNGKPIAKECLNVWTGTERNEYILAATNRDGVVVLHLSNREVFAESGCADWPVRAPRDPSLDAALEIIGDYYVACQEYAKINTGDPLISPLTGLPSYSIKTILESGIAAANTCGKIRAEAKPGQLIFFVRPRTFSERMRQ